MEKLTRIAHFVVESGALCLSDIFCLLSKVKILSLTKIFRQQIEQIKRI